MPENKAKNRYAILPCKLLLCYISCMSERSVCIIKQELKFRDVSGSFNSFFLQFADLSSPLLCSALLCSVALHCLMGWAVLRIMSVPCRAVPCCPVFLRAKYIDLCCHVVAVSLIGLHYLGCMVF